MHNSRMLLIIALILLFPAIATCASLPTDRVLDKPVKLVVKGEALSDIMPMLEKQTGVRVRVAMEIADQKATIFIDDKPLRQVMEGISTLFGYHWTKKTFSTGDIYELWQADSARQKLSGRYAKAWEDAWKAATDDIKFKAKVSSMSAEVRSSLRHKLTEGGEQTKAQLDALTSVEKDPFLGPAARLFCEMPSDIRKMVRPGVRIKYHSLSTESDWVLPEDKARALLEAIRSKSPGWLDQEVSGIGLTFTCQESDRVVDILATLAMTTESAPRSFSTSSLGTWLTYQRVFEHLPDDGLVPARASDMSALQKTVSITAEDIQKETGVTPASGDRPKANRSDILAILHRKLRLQIISDHYSQWDIWKMMGDTTPLAVAEAFDAPTSDLPVYEARAAWGWDGELLCMRTKDIWHSDSAEVPNRLLRKWAASYRDPGYLDLSEQAAVAALSKEQSVQLTLSREYLGLRKETGGRNTDALRLFGLLSEKQQKEALDAGTPVERFTPEQMKALQAVQPGAMALMTIGSDGVANSPVGVWTTGRPEYRLDRPQAAQSGGVPVFVSIREGTPSVANGAVTSGVRVSVQTTGSFVGSSSSDGGPPDMSTLKDVMLKSLNEGNPGDLNYTMVLSHADGPSLEIGISIPGPKPEETGAAEQKK